jgi:benzoyl-CoA reductase/2-hydroxyglutaryl-CoA dehydratase subunit BcrC/BadD/HgdB
MEQQTSTETRIARRTPGAADRWNVLYYKLINLGIISKMVLKRGPIGIFRELRHYPWIWDLLKVNTLIDKMTVGRTGLYSEAVAYTISHIAAEIVAMLETIFYEGDRMVLNEDLVPPEILRAMGLKPWLPEGMGIVIPLIVPDGMETYIDAAENEGVPADICSLPKATMGMALKGCQPPAGAIVTSNLPCDGGMTSYNIIARQLGAPMFSLDAPFNFKDGRALDYFSGQLREMISWLEEKTPGRMDWDRLREICETRNRLVELELELWDMVRKRPAPMAAEVVYLSHLWAFNVYPGMPSSVRLFEKLTAMCRANLEAGVSAVPNERFRAILWNPPTLHASDLFVWAEKAYGVSLIMDSMTFNRQPFIDTTSQESMLKGLSLNIMDGPMVRHTRGPAENFFNDIFHIVKAFDIDMLWVAGHIGCKNTQALNGMLREMCRERKIPLLVIDYDLMDPRIETRDGIIRQVDHFMENIMKVRRLDA